MNPSDAAPPKPLAPVHERWPEILRYPLQPAALSTIVALAVAHLVTHLMLGWIFDLAVWAAFFKYAFEVLRWSANGRAQAPEISFTVSDAIARHGVLLLVLAQLLLVLLALIFGVVAAFVAGLVLMLAMPAVMIVLALEEGVLRALTPIV